MTYSVKPGFKTLYGLFVAIFIIFCLLSISSLSLAQQPQGNQPFMDMGKKVKEEYGSLEYVSIYNKVPFIEKGIPDELTLDTAKPDADQKVAIRKFIEFKKYVNNTLNNLYLKNAPFEYPGYTHAFVNNNVIYEKKIIAVAEDLYAGKLTFGQFNKKRQQLFSEYEAQQAATRLEYDKKAATAKAGVTASTAIKTIEQPIPALPPPSSFATPKPLPPPPQPINQPSQAIVIGKTYDPDANGYLTLYSSGCRNAESSQEYPYYWEATNANGSAVYAPNGQQMTGCYLLNQQTSQVVLNANGKTLSVPFANFSIGSNQGGGGITDFLRAIGNGLQRATTYWNNSAAQTQSSTTNLTGTIGGNNRGLTCVPDGRGGYFCR